MLLVAAFYWLVLQHRHATNTGSGLCLGKAVVDFSACASGDDNDTSIIEYCNLINAGANRPSNLYNFKCCNYD
jgi:hypothetical protein